MKDALYSCLFLVVSSCTAIAYAGDRCPDGYSPVESYSRSHMEAKWDGDNMWETCRDGEKAREFICGNRLYRGGPNFHYTYADGFTEVSVFSSVPGIGFIYFAKGRTLADTTRDFCRDGKGEPYMCFKERTIVSSFNEYSKSIPDTLYTKHISQDISICRRFSI